VSGPITAEDVNATSVEPVRTRGRVLEVTPSRLADVGGVSVRRALPRRGRRTVGAWCFLDHFGPAGLEMNVGPHPHIGLQTVTWLLEGDILHTDSLGSEQRIRPGQLNLMTAGRGVAHAEVSVVQGTTHGVQLWIAQPDATRHAVPAFEHHAELPLVNAGGWTGTVVTGEFAGVRSPARADTPLVGVDLAGGRGAAQLPLDAGFEHALVVLTGAVEVEGALIQPGALVYLGTGREALRLEALEAVRLLLIGGEPFGVEPLMWWNYVARTREEIEQAHRDWETESQRFGQVRSNLARMPSPAPVWSRPT
jgi:quercetin 2,3-dioxygenase